LMHETTGLCPFLKSCETRIDHRRIEKRLLKERRMFLAKTSFLDRVKYHDFMKNFEGSFNNLNRIDARCFSYYKKCLRFWQKCNHKNKPLDFNQPIHEYITQFITRQSE
jgi:hypothetical protein